ncbi:MAG: AAA family ATPase [Alphaproteobacteria bacterium]|nr:AAA family ATPase [Alphaproteobacteria bacterium]
MRCPRCGAYSPAGKKFCGDCGAALAVICLSCGTANSAGEDLCSRCGTVLDAPGFGEAGEPWGGADRRELSGELRPVTVLFCDIVNSTALTERLGAEAMRDLVHGFIEASLAEVHRFGGTAPQFRGDGFMALFGAPLTQEDHVRRALLAAMAIQRAVAEGEASRLSGADLKIRIGIHTGPVVFGAIGGSFPTRTAIGDTANVAARMEQAAAPGTILVSEAVHALAQDYARLEPVGRLTVKGKSEPIAAFRLLGVSHWRAVRDAVSPPRMPSFVGRDRELGLLEGLLSEVEDGSGRVVAVVGEPGIGKSRLLTELRRRAGERQVVWIDGGCVSYGAGIPYQLVLDLLRSHCGILETDAAEAIAQKLGEALRAAGINAEQDGPVLLHLLGIKHTGDLPTLSNPEAIKTKSFEVLQRLFLEVSRRQTLVLVLEDLHWIDSISEEFLGALATYVAEARILLLVSCRPEYRPLWGRDIDLALIRLEPLSPQDGLHVVRSMLPDDEIDEPLREEIVARAEGNPLFLEQLALHAGESGEMRAGLPVPQTIHGVVMARIDRLPEAMKQLLQTAAVIGREFSLRLLHMVWHGRGPLAARLRELARLEFLDEWPDDEETSYIFRHVLTQEAAYSSLLERDRRTLHGEIGHALEQLYRGRVDEVAELLALHFGRSNGNEKAVDYAIAAAVKAQRRWANNEALAYFDDALHRLDLISDTGANRLRRIDAVIKQAEVKFALGRQAEHIATLEDIRGIVEETDDPHRRATWHYWIGFLHSLTGSPTALAIEHCREAAAIASSAGCNDLEGFIYSCMALAYLVAGELRAAIVAGDRALAIFEAQANLWWASRTLWHLAQAATFLGEWTASQSYCRRALAHGATLNDLRLKVVGLYRTGSAHIHQGDIEHGLRYCDDALALKPIPYDAAMARAFRGYGMIKGGQLDSGIAELTEAIAWLDRSHLRHGRSSHTLRLAEGYIQRGDLAAARALIDDGLTTSRAMGCRYLEGLALRLMAECLVADSPDIAVECVDDAQRIFAAIDAQNDLAKALVTRARLYQNYSNFRAARELLEEAAAIFSRLGTLDEPARVNAALIALERGSPTQPLGDAL